MLLGMLDRYGEQLFLSFAGFGNRWDNRYLQAPGEFGRIEAQASPLGGVDHVQRQDQGNAQLEELDGQVKIPLPIRGIHDVDDYAGSVVDEEIPRHQFFQRVGCERIGAGQVHQSNLRAVQVAEAFLLFDRDAGVEVTRILLDMPAPPEHLRPPWLERRR